MEKQKFKLIIFDLDGTLVDTSEGIFDCYNFALKKMGVAEPYDLNGVIGGPLVKTFKNHFGLEEKQAKLATNIYRKHYAEVGIDKSKLYDGIYECLLSLKNAGYKLAVATLKAEKLAIPLLTNLGIAQFFDIIHGVDSDDKLTKSDLINICLTELKVEKREAILVGDSIHDKNGADLSNIDFLPVTYGFGFDKNFDFSKINCFTIANSTQEISKIIQK